MGAWRNGLPYNETTEASLFSTPLVGVGCENVFLRPSTHKLLRGECDEEKSFLCLRPHQPPVGKTTEYALMAAVGVLSLTVIPKS